MAPWMIKLGATALSGWLANKQAGKAQKSANQNADWAYGQSNPQEYRGMFGGFNPKTGEYLNEDMQGSMDDYLNRSRATGDQIGDYNMDERAAMAYDQEMALLAPEFAAQSAGLEARQLQQGRLNTTGGAMQFSGLMNSQATTGQKVRRDSWGRANSDLDNMRRRENEDFGQAMRIGGLAGNYANQSFNFANQRGQNAWNSANMKSGAALGRAGANAGMIKTGLQGFIGQGYTPEGKANEGWGTGLMSYLGNGLSNTTERPDLNNEDTYARELYIAQPRPNGNRY